MKLACASHTPPLLALLFASQGTLGIRTSGVFVRHETAVRRLPKTVDISEAQRRYRRGSLTVQRYVALSL